MHLSREVPPLEPPTTSRHLQARHLRMVAMWQWQRCSVCIYVSHVSCDQCTMHVHGRTLTNDAARVAMCIVLRLRASVCLEAEALVQHIQVRPPVPWSLLSPARCISVIIGSIPSRFLLVATRWPHVQLLFGQAVPARSVQHVGAYIPLRRSVFANCRFHGYVLSCG